MNLFDAITRYVADTSRRRRYRRTERLIGSLPLDIRKDIGWPGAATGADDMSQPPYRH